MSDGIKQIRIVTCEFGNASGIPKWVQESWVGLVIPYEYYISKRDINEKFKLLDHLGEPWVAPVGGFVVKTSVAFEILKSKNLKAYGWYKRRSVCYDNGVLKLNYDIIFLKAECERT